MAKNHNIIVTFEADGSSTGTSGPDLLVEADPNPLLAEGKFCPGHRVTWHFTGLKDGQVPFLLFHHGEPGTGGDPQGPFKTLSVSKNRIVGRGDGGHASSPIFYDICVIDPSTPETSLIKPRWRNPLPDLTFGGLEEPKRPHGVPELASRPS